MVVVDLVALVAILVSVRVSPSGSGDLGRFVVLAVGSAVHIEASRHIERLREVVTEGVPYVNLKSMWLFAGALVLPLRLALLLVLTTYIHSWFRLRRVPIYRWAFSTASIVLAASSAAVIMTAVSPHSYPGFPPGPRGLVASVLAGLAYWLVNYALVVGAIILSNPGAPGGQALGRLADQWIVAGGLGLGLAVAVLLVHDPWAVSVLVLTVLGLHRGLLLGQFQNAANTDSKTGLMEATFWHKIATAELARAERLGTQLGLLMIDIDDFKSINDTYGHLNGDRVLKAVSRAIQQQVREYDLVGRFGGEEFVVLLPQIDGAEIAHAAERIRHRIAHLQVDLDEGKLAANKLTCSVGGAVYPGAATTLDQLLLAADTATYEAKDRGRNRVQMAPNTKSKTAPSAQFEPTADR
ncbi:MAG: GGDEF domain-containing protein [Pseudonocardiales bacterium]|nr:MAG: GGDEF domain-containing protein [Pseudonocardiales bacterium]